jgi:hypothetical protein
MAKHWKVEAESVGRHVHVRLRAGPKPQDRALLGGLVMDAEEWHQFRHAMHQGLPAEIDDSKVDYLGIGVPQ